MKFLNTIFHNFTTTVLGIGTVLLSNPSLVPDVNTQHLLTGAGVLLTVLGKSPLHQVGD